MATWKKIITSGSAAELASLTLDTGLANSELANSTVSFGGVSLALGQSDATPAFDLSDATGYTGDSNLVTVGALDSGGSITSGFGNIDIGTSTLNTGNATVDTLTNDSTVAGSHLTGSFTGSFVGDGSNLTGVSALSFKTISVSGQDDVVADTATDTLTLTAGEGIDITTDASGDSITFAGEDASTSNKGVASFASANFDVSSGAVSVKAGGIPSASIAADAIDANHLADDSVKAAALNSDVAGTGLQQHTDGTLRLASQGAGIAGGAGSTLSVDLSGITNQTIGDGSGTTTIGNNLVINNDLTVNGTTTTVATTNTVVEDQLLFLATGSKDTNKDAGIVVQHGSTDLQGRALYHDTDSSRWSVGESVAHNASSIEPNQFVATVKTQTVNPDSTSGSYGAGEMHVNTSTGDIWIRYG